MNKVDEALDIVRKMGHQVSVPLAVQVYIKQLDALLQQIQTDYIEPQDAPEEREYMRVPTRPDNVL